jgi:hypothetical protein
MFTRGQLRTIGLAAGVFCFLALAAQAAVAFPVALCAGRSFDPYKTNLATLKACGIKVLPRSSQRGLPGGETEYDYHIGAGQQDKVRVPPKAFQPATATSEQLKTYGIPEAPPASNTAARNQWRNVLAKMHFVSPPAYLVAVPTRAGIADLAAAEEPKAKTSSWMGVRSGLPVRLPATRGGW